MRKILPPTSRKRPGISKKSPAATTDDLLSHLAFDNGALANIISTVRTGKIIMANTAACKLLGYSKKELLSKNRADIFDIHETSFKKMLKQRTAEGRSIALVTAIKKSGKQVQCEITSAVFKDEKGIEKAITTVSDLSQTIRNQKNIDTKKERVVAHNIDLAKSKQKKIDRRKERVVANNIDIAKSKQIKIDIGKEKVVADDIIAAEAKSEARIIENNQWLKYIGKISYDVMWDWDIPTGHVYIGDSVKEVFGYKLQSNSINFSDLKRFLGGENNTVEENLMIALASHKKDWKDSYTIKRQGGSLASVTSRATIVRDEEGKAIRLIGATLDVSRMQELEQKLEAQIIIHDEDSEKFLLAAKLSFDVIWDWNLISNELFIGGGFEELFGYPITNNKSTISTFLDHIHPDDKAMIEAELNEAIMSSAVNWEHIFRFTRADGSVARVFKRASIIRNADGKAYRIIGAMQDLSRQKELEEKLEQEILLKEKQIADATSEAKETERSDIGKELHDNVNQLLGVSRMYLDMAKRGGAESGMHMSRSSEYTLSAIEEIRKLTRGLTTDIIKNLGLCEAIEKIARDTMEVSPVKIASALDSFIENSVTEKFKLNAFRIVQEQLNNILKHAQATEVRISLVQTNHSIVLSISDNGVGFDTCKKQKGIGIANIKSRATAYGGIADLISQPDQGCVLTITFPGTDTLLNKN